MKFSTRIIFQVGFQDAAQVILVEDDHMIEALAFQCSDQTLAKTILPGRPRRDDFLLDAQISQGADDLVAVDPVPIPDQEPGRRIERKGL